MVVSGRKLRVGPEAELIESALSSSPLYKKRGNVVIFREPQLPTGFPDLVAVYPGKRAITFNQFRSDLSLWHIRLLHLIYQVGGGYPEEISQSSLYPEAKVRILIDELYQAGMVYFRGKKVLPVSIRRLFNAKRIVAIEAKINDWRKAIRQAIANTWFSSHSYILMPYRGNMSKIINEAESFGIGVMAYDGKKTIALCRPKPQELPTSYGSWLFNEWAISMIH